MILSEYMKTYGRKSLTRKEAAAFGIIMTKGWKKRYSNTEITEEMLISLLSGKVSKSRRSQKCARNALFGDIAEQPDGGNKFLYLMENINGLLKIGISKDPINRAKQLTTGSGVPVFCKAVWKVALMAKDVEQYLHKVYSPDRLEGEWFSPKAFTTEDVENEIPCDYERVYTINEGIVNALRGKTLDVPIECVVTKTEKAFLFRTTSGKEHWVAKSLVYSISNTSVLIKDIGQKYT